MADSKFCEHHRKIICAQARARRKQLDKQYLAEFGMTTHHVRKYAALGITTERAKQLEAVRKVWRSMSAYKRNKYKARGLTKEQAAMEAVI